MGEWSREIAPVEKWLIIAALAIALWWWAPDIYGWLKAESFSWIKELKR